jgi:hypothetical protein
MFYFSITIHCESYMLYWILNHDESQWILNHDESQWYIIAKWIRVITKLPNSEAMRQDSNVIIK